MFQQKPPQKTLVVSLLKAAKKTANNITQYNTLSVIFTPINAGQCAQLPTNFHIQNEEVEQKDQSSFQYTKICFLYKRSCKRYKLSRTKEFREEEHWLG